MRKEKDNPLAVRNIWTLEFLRSCFVVHGVYHYLVSGWGIPAMLEGSIWSIDSILLVTHLIELIVHLFFSYRVFIYFLIYKQFRAWRVHIEATFATSLVAPSFHDFDKHITPNLALSALSCAITTDWLITGSLIMYLEKSRMVISRRTSVLVDRLIYYAINIGILTSLTDVAVLALTALNLSNSLVYLAVFDVVGNFYANSLLATLNVRKSMASSVESTDPISTMSAIELASPPGRRLSGTQAQSRTLVFTKQASASQPESAWSTSKSRSLPIDIELAQTKD
ncbi:hypothetical protein EVG20_g7465 [Dentipellis fragilis]|uniref:DUF6534 domain-containing protein n=1 Tax=Dentipellis fragilis TaxID=205917 RepID=A0A4Y9YDL9_9AGAM|nr:hypothetical protein EVG20_g7465 [Dentipellis fragilis]